MGVAEVKGFFGAANDMGGNALDDDSFLSSVFGVSVEDSVVKGLFGGAFDIGGKPADDEDEGLEDDVVNGDLGASFDIGGNAGEGADSEDFTVDEVNGLFGAAFDIGGKAALDGDGDFPSFLGAAKLKPDNVAAGALDDPTPNENPPEEEAAVAGTAADESSTFFDAAAEKLKPPNTAGAGAGAVGLTPNENPPVPILPGAGAEGSPNENPPAPILPNVEAALAEEDVLTALPSVPGFGVPHAAHMVSDGPFVTKQASHFQDPSSLFLNTPPQPIASVDPSLVLLSFSVSDLAVLSSPSDSSSLSSSPNSHSMYQDMKAFRVITLSLDEPSFVLILRIVRLCSSSQYVEPSDSRSFGKSVTEI